MNVVQELSGHPVTYADYVALPGLQKVLYRIWCVYLIRTTCQLCKLRGQDNLHVAMSDYVGSREKMKQLNGQTLESNLGHACQSHYMVIAVTVTECPYTVLFHLIT